MKKTTLLFDVSGIVDGIVDGRGNGIFFCGYNILKEFLRRDYLNIVLYCAPQKAHIFELAKKMDEHFINVPLAEYSDIDDALAYWEGLKYQNRIEKGSKIKRLHIKLTLVFLKLFQKISCKICHSPQYQEIFKDVDIFFSPVGAVPDEISLIKHIKKCNIIHDVIPLVVPEYKKGFKKSPFYKLFKTINKKDYYFANSEYTKQDFIKYIPKINPDNTTVIPLSAGADYKQITDANVFNQVKQKYNIPTDKKYLFSLCTLEPRKNLIFSIKNFIEFIKKNEIKDFVYILGGNAWGSFEDKLKAEIPDIEKYKDKIIKIGYVQDEDMAALYSGAEMFVFPSLYEGFGMPILEAMKCGCPVICSNLTSMPEVIGDCGIQIDPKNNEDLINAFSKMYFNEKFRKQSSIMGLKRAELFTWERCIDTILNKLGVAECQKSLL